MLRFILTGLVWSLLLRPAVPAERPNVVLVVVDDYGWADSGCYGSKFHKTPHIDKMAADGARFTQAYAACPVCSPTRAAVLTGLYPARLHLTDWLPGRRDLPSQRLLRPNFQQQLALERTTLAEYLTAAGYTCASIGKWHLGGNGFEPTAQGFAHRVAGDALGTPVSYFAPYKSERGQMPGLEAAPEGEYLTDRLAQECENFIEQNRSRPFFLYLPHFAVHTPLKAKPELIEKYQQQLGRPWQPSAQQNNPIYAAMIESLDDSIGRIVKKLADCGLTDNTLIVFTSDNGGLATTEGPNTPSTINAPLREGKGWLYEGGIRVPLIVKKPGQVPAGSVNESVVCSIDLLPTILEMCGISHDVVDGISFKTALTSNSLLPSRSLFWHYPHYANQGGRPGGVVRSGDYKLIEFYENGRRELYNLRADIRESTNLADKHPDLVAKLHAELKAWRDTVSAQMPSPNPNFVPNPQAPDGSVLLHARTADIHGIMVRYEPLPHKNTVGFWTRLDDWISWEFQLEKPGDFDVVILQGCGNGSGGSEVEFRLAGQTVKMTVQETGGFQQFLERNIGSVKIGQEGRQVLEVRPVTKPGVAVMDLRQVTLKPRM